MTDKLFKIDLLDQTGNEIVITTVQSLIINSANILLACTNLEMFIKSMLSPRFEVNFTRTRESSKEIYIKVSILDPHTDNNMNLTYGVYQ